MCAEQIFVVFTFEVHTVNSYGNTYCIVCLGSSMCMFHNPRIFFVVPMWPLRKHSVLGSVLLNSAIGSAELYPTV